MKKTLALIAMTTILTMGLPCNHITCNHAHAETKPTGVAVVNVQKIVSKSLASNHVKKQLEEKREAYQKEIDKEEETLRKKDKELADQRSLLAPEAYKEKVSEFKKKVATVQKDVQKKRAHMDKAYAKALSKIQDITIEVISELSKEKGFDVAIPANSILFTKAELDISDDVLKRLDKRLPKLDIVFDKIEDEKE